MWPFIRFTNPRFFFGRPVLLHKTKGITTYKAKVEKRLGITLLAFSLKNQIWDGYCKQCCKEIETIATIFEYEKTRAYLDALSLNTGLHRIYNLKNLLGDYYLWSDQKKEPNLSSVSATSFVIADIMKGRLTGDKLSWK